MPPKNVIRLIYGCQYRRALSVSSNVMSIRRTDKHCGARLVAAPATLHVAPLLFSFLLYPAFRLPTLPSASLPLSPSTPISLCLQTRLCAATYNHSTLPPYLPPPYTGPYTAPTPLLQPPPSPPLPAAVAFALELDKGRERACVL